MRLRHLKGIPIESAETEDGRGFLILSDLHLGLTSRMGLRRPLPEEEASEVCRRIESASRQTGARNLIILGDLKHGLFEPSIYEKKALRSLTENLTENFEVWVMKGNHDFGIEESMDSRVKMIGRNGLELDGVVFIHGHSLPRLSENLDSYQMIVCGHIHPQWAFEGEWKPVWLVLKARGHQKPQKVVILPHFNVYASRAGYRPGPPLTIAPFLKRLNLSRYGFQIMDLGLDEVASGNASEIMPVINAGGAGRI